jgi:hypothetical protein
MEVHEIAGSDFERRARRGGPEGGGQDARSKSSPLHHTEGVAVFWDECFLKIG